MIFTNIPIGPSVNNIYKPIRGRFIKSEEGRIYEQKIQIYKLRNFRKLQEATQLFKDKELCIDKYFVFPNKMLYNKDKTVKRRDIENYLKTTIDGVSTLLGIDDKFFRSGICEGIFCQNEEDSQLIINITFHKMRSLDELKSSLLS